MRKLISIIAFLSLALSAAAQEGWIMEATSRKDYNGATMANGRLGVVTDDRPFTAREIVLAGVFDKEGYNGVSRVARGPVFLNMELTVDGDKVRDNDFSDWNQVFDMKNAWGMDSRMCFGFRSHFMSGHPLLAQNVISSLAINLNSFRYMDIFTFQTGKAAA